MNFIFKILALLAVIFVSLSVIVIISILWQEQSQMYNGSGKLTSNGRKELKKRNDSITFDSLQINSTSISLHLKNGNICENSLSSLRNAMIVDFQDKKGKRIELIFDVRDKRQREYFYSNQKIFRNLAMMEKVILEISEMKGNPNR